MADPILLEYFTICCRESQPYSWVSWTVFRSREYSPEQLAEFDAARPESHVATDETLRPASKYNSGGIIFTLVGAGLWNWVMSADLDKQLYVLAGGFIAFGLLQIAIGAMQTKGKTNNGLYHIVHDLFHMPRVMKQLAVVQFFSWFALFAMWIYTTAAVTINESADPSVRSDILKVLNDAVPWEGGYMHLEGNSAAHVKASLMGSSALVAIEADGSAYFKVPARKPLYFQVLDEKGHVIQTMRSWSTLMPGENFSCVGCHEHRRQAPSMAPAHSLAMSQPVQTLVPQPGDRGPRTVDYAADVQPVLNKHCVGCHGGSTPQGRLDLTGDRTRLFSMAYDGLIERGMLKVATVRTGDDPTKKTSKESSPILRITKHIDGSHYDAKLTPLEQDFIRYWIESGAVYPGTYAALGTGMIGGFPLSQLDTRERTQPGSLAGPAAAEPPTSREST